jgi:NitT/TauT family transport system permease protein
VRRLAPHCAALLLLSVIWSLLRGWPTPQQALTAFDASIRSGELAVDITASLLRVGAGVFIALLFAALTLALSRVSTFVGEVVFSCCELLRPVPPIAWTPFAVIALGVGNASAVVVVVVGAYFPMLSTLQKGLRDVVNGYVMAAASLGATRTTTLFGVFLPSILPSLLSGLRIANGIGWFTVVAAEMMGASSGLGYGLLLASANLDYSRCAAYIGVVGVVGWVTGVAFSWFERRYCQWNRQEFASDDRN